MVVLTSFRQKIVDAILSTDINMILITHGTDTIIETAQYIHTSMNKQSRSKCIVITGELARSIIEEYYSCRIVVGNEKLEKAISTSSLNSKVKL